MFAMVHVRNGVELGRCRVAHDELGYPLLVATMREPEMLELVEGMEAGDELRFEEGDRAVPPVGVDCSACDGMGCDECDGAGL